MDITDSPYLTTTSATGGMSMGGLGSIFSGVFGTVTSVFDNCGIQCTTAYPPFSGKAEQRNACINNCNASKQSHTYVNQGMDIGTVALLGIGAVVLIKLLN